MPYAVGALLKYPLLRPLASPALTGPELSRANGICLAVIQLLHDVGTAAAGNMSASTFFSSKQDMASAVCLEQSDVEVMFAAVVLKKKIDHLRSQVPQNIVSWRKAAESIPDEQALGLARLSITVAFF